MYYEARVWIDYVYCDRFGEKLLCYNRIQLYYHSQLIVMIKNIQPKQLHMSIILLVLSESMVLSE